MYYKQCKLQKESKEYVVWIPENLAVKGKTLVIRGDPGWKVTWASERKKDYDHLCLVSRSYTRTRRHSDI